MHLIDGTGVASLLDYPALIEALEAGHRGAPPLVDRSLLQHADDSFLVLPAWLPGTAMGVKMATVVPGNATRVDELPTIHAAYQLFCGETGQALAAIDGTTLTLFKTAADSGLGARLLAPRHASTLLMVGAGALAPHLVAAHRAARPSIERVLVWNRTPSHRDALVAQLRDEGIDAVAIDDLDAAAPEADIISCATATTTPLIAGERLRAGQHLDLVGAFRPDMRESDDACVRRARLFVDLRLSTLDSAGDLTQPVAAGVITRDEVLADLFELIGDHVTGRSHDDDITLFKNGGGGHLDLMTAWHCWQRYQATRT